MLSFDEESHTYTLNGKILVSVTQILKEIFPEKYKDVPKEILDQKSIYGTDLHKYIEIIEKKKPKKPIAYIKRYFQPNIYQIASLEQYLEIKDKYNIKVLESEKRVHYKDLYAGTLDLKAKVNGKLAIIDIKTTSELDELYVSYQNSFYELADESVEELYCLWLPKKHLGKLVKVKRIDKELLLKLI